MTRPPRFLSGANSSSSSSSSATSSEAEPPEAAAVESDFVVVLAALLCALICVVGLIAVARCAWLRRRGAVNGRSAAPNKGLKKKVLQSLPKFTYDSATNAKLGGAECAICLAEYANGDEIRVLPQCGHGFHVSCIDTWLGSHSSCPSCRQILAKSRGRDRVENSADSGGGGPTEAELKAREDPVASSGFVPF